MNFQILVFVFHVTLEKILSNNNDNINFLFIIYKVKYHKNNMLTKNLRQCPANSFP